MGCSWTFTRITVTEEFPGASIQLEDAEASDRRDRLPITGCRLVSGCHVNTLTFA